MANQNGKQRKLKWLRYSWGDRMFLLFTYAVVIILALICLYPLYFTVIASISEPNAVYSGKVNLLPSGFTLEAYTAMLENDSIWRGYANTIFYTIAGTCFNIFLTIPCAYALSKQKMYGRGFLTGLFLFTMYFGGGMIPTYLLFDSLNLINTRWILIISGGLSVYNVVIARTYFQTNISESLCEAARIDGANEFYIFWKLVLPLSAPIIAVITLYYAVGHWSSYFDAMIYVMDTDLHPLQLVLRRILILNETAFDEAVMSGNDSGDTLAMLERLRELATTMRYSLVFIASAPMLIAYPFIQKYFIKGIMVGSLKG